MSPDDSDQSTQTGTSLAIEDNVAVVTSRPLSLEMPHRERTLIAGNFPKVKIPDRTDRGFFHGLS